MAVEVIKDFKCQRRYEFTTSSGIVAVTIPEILEDGEVYEIGKFFELILSSSRKRETEKPVSIPPPYVDPSPVAPISPPPRHEDLIGEF